MRDDFLSADWAQAHHALSNDIHKLIVHLADAWSALSRARFIAPWRVEDGDCPAGTRC